MYNYKKIFAKSFTGNKHKRFALLGSFIMAFTIWILLKPYLCRFSMETGHLQMLIINNTTISRGHLEPIIIYNNSKSNPRSDFCEMVGDIRVHGNSSTVSLAVPASLQSQRSWSMKPYIRTKDNAPAMNLVKNWSFHLVNQTPPWPCHLNHSVPAILFSLGGFSGNHFHDFSDLVIPLYITSLPFHGQVQFLVTDNRPWWIVKFRRILDKLSNHQIIDIDLQHNVHCYSTMIVGLKFHKHFGIDPSKSATGLSMKDFRDFIRSTYSLKAADHNSRRRPPRLLIISRRHSRSFLNLGTITKTATELGYQVVVAEATLTTDLSTFAQIVNSCDVLMGVHGAGLTNMVFLPDNAVVIQIVPLGEIDWLARQDFEEPSVDMNIRYLEYKISIKESSLLNQYPIDHPIFTDPMSVHNQGWDAVKSLYLEKQNVKLDMHRFTPTLFKALELLHH